VAVAAGNGILSLKHLAMAHGQAEALLPLIDMAMREAQLPASALDLVAVTTGPGSFTGIRVGFAAARGISLGLDVPLLGVSCFEAAAAICHPDPAERFLLVALESRRADLYVQIFDPARRPLGKPAAVLPEALAETVTALTAGGPLAVTGDAAPRAVAALAGGSVLDEAPAALGVQRAALRRWRRGERADSARPLYLRPPGVTLAAGPLVPGGL